MEMISGFVIYFEDGRKILLSKKKYENYKKRSLINVVKKEPWSDISDAREAYPGIWELI